MFVFSSTGGSCSCLAKGREYGPGIYAGGDRGAASAATVTVRALPSKSNSRYSLAVTIVVFVVVIVIVIVAFDVMVFGTIISSITILTRTSKIVTINFLL